MATYANYNGIAFQNIKVRNIEYQTKLDKSGVDPIYTEVTVTFTSVVTIAGKDTGRTFGNRVNNIQDAWHDIETRLNQPRREFRLTLAGEQLFWVGPGRVQSVSPVTARPVAADPTKAIAGDCNNGPFPSVRFNKFVSNYSVSVDFTVKMALVFCDYSVSADLSGLTNFRYWVNETIDGRDWMTVRTYSGRIRVAHSGINVHLAMRSANMLPPLQKGFIRDRIHIKQDPNGLELEFTVQDREVAATPPWPASHWDGSHIITTPMGSVGPMADGSINVRLTAPRSVKKSELMKLAANIIDSRVHFDEMARGEFNAILLGVNLRSSISKNEIEMGAKIRYFGKDDGSDTAYLYNMFTDDINSWYTQAGYDREIAYPHQQTAPLAGLFVTALQDPCHSARFPSASGAPTGQLVYDPDDDDDQKPTVSVDTGTLPQDTTQYTDQANYSDEHKHRAFTVYTIDSDLEIDSGVITMPLGQAIGGGGSTNSSISLHSGDARRIVELHGERIGEWPPMIRRQDFVNLDAAGQNPVTHTVIRWDLMSKNAQLSADGRKTLYSASQRVVYSLDVVPNEMVHEVPTGKTPYRSDRTQVSIANMPASAFVSPTEII